MEVSGQKALKDKNIEHCSFCEDYDITTYADGYCLECEVYICDACFVKHKGRRVNRNHSLVNVEDSNSVKAKVDDTYDTCQYHIGEPVKFYCSKHDQVCCGDCTVLNHNGCKMEFISKKAETFENSPDCKNLREGLNKCKTEAEDSVSLIATNRQQLSDLYETFVRDVETFAGKILERINSMKKKVLNQAKDVMLNNKRKMDDIQKETNDLIAEISHQISLLDSKKDQPNKLFVTSLLVKPELKRTQHNIDIIKKKNAVTKYIFKRDQKLEEMMKESKGIGLLLEHQETSNLYQKEYKQTSSVEEAKVKDPLYKVETKVSPGELEDCDICLCGITEPKRLYCGHAFCKECIEQQSKFAEKCPTCAHVFGEITGDQPDGTMDVYVKRYPQLSGYYSCDTIVITYTFQDGKQRENHPNPGKWYKGIQTRAYLPDTKEGRKIAKMLKVAFERKLVFTIGSSRTTGQEGVITWNDIHHKTDSRPHTQFGYPDPTYLERVKDELAAKGVTENDISGVIL
ncbi:E3 ubiquitin-protein ligase DTX3L-like [Ruditapes philippinarum]|uniref:E3 ubiquitin-protein ligase DTX3L-like n=1 Tax=Ruditapes philippinarum TaxID=129788 RepID=UPI00295BDC68|nr:E3 ubiquitin-protein ligase DTX3L-like [Ruditapes philippinarum]XP_060604619.1 E3 ubiquitin-protein ligase DTX3L-like [Ruditapes philippinarum]XP_060604625.1 E3 ubiquitin-protein ligase DTX3L-like [Ruditapes philippinarum]XP_060604634.1 E3 ubiquitin-protein ligase DTX3L-like [Ruditapes philippinarum]XP_060604641.1 E3 ubiquitin-protein ligase DTX3L-like [Ruditapes philippinarum]